MATSAPVFFQLSRPANPMSTIGQKSESATWLTIGRSHVHAAKEKLVTG